MRQFAIYLLLLLLVASTLSGCALLPTGRSGQAAADEPTPTPIPTPIVPLKPTYTVARGEIVKSVTFSARSAPVVEEELFFRVDGRVRSVLAKRDDNVIAGQVLAELEIDNLERELASGKLELDRALSRLEQAEGDREDAIHRAQLNLEIAQINLASARAHSMEPRRAQAAADLEKARIARDKAQEDYNAVAWRSDVGRLPQASILQQATVDYERAKAAYDMAIQDIDNQSYNLQVLQKQVELAQLTVNGLQASVDSLLQNDVARARLNVARLEAAIADARIIAPFSGRLLSISLTPGRAIEGFRPVAVIADTKQIELSADLLSNQMQDLAEGMALTAELTSRPGVQLTGQLRRLPYPYGTGGGGTNIEEMDKSTRIELDQTPEEAGLQLGDLVRVTVEIERKEDVLWLPPQAIRVFDGRRFVVLQEGDTQRRVDVKVGIQTEDRIEIEEGLTEGQVVQGQ